MAKLYLVLLAVVVYRVNADQNNEDQDFIPNATQNKREIVCGKYYAQYPNPEDCSSYIVCQNGQKTTKSCPSGQHYNFKTIRCEEKCDAYCDKTLSCECKWSTCGLDDVCFLEQIVGGCRNRVTRYFFDKRTGQCERFGYSGCMGNENNFETLEECQQKCSNAKPIPGFSCLTLNGRFPNPDNCRTYFQCSEGNPRLMSCEAGLHYSDKSKTCEKPCNAYCDKSLSCKCKWPTCGLDDLCFLPPEVGPCRAGFYNYYFNRRTGKCEKFLYGGCKGNKNNFQKKEECEKACNKDNDSPAPTSEDLTELTSEEFTESSSYEFPDLITEDILDPDFECGPDDLYPHPKNCRSFVKCSKGVPTLNTCPGKLHFNNDTKKCSTPCKAHCDRTYACKCNWPTCGTNALCFLPAKPGPCKGKFERFYFNKRSAECMDFEYGGCLGNENNFLTKNACERKCIHSLDICKLPYKTGLCKGKFERYYFNHKEGKCQKFTFGGCNKNENNFKTLEECETTCLHNKHQEAYPLLGCPENDSWGNVDDCSSYFKCSGGETHLINCPSGQHFNNALKRCTAPCDAFCEPSIACSCEWPICKNGEEFTCVRDGLFKHPESCSSYIHCVKGEKYDMPCPKGHHYNEKTKFCEEPSKAQCKDLKEVANSEPTCTEDGVRADMESCRRYIQCSNGQQYVMPCPQGLHFNEASNQCDSPCDARCDMSLAMQCGWPVSSDFTGDSHCPENEHLSLSGAACQRNCTNYKDWIVPCPLIWRPGCVCDSGYVRSSEGKCIPTDECESDNQHSDSIELPRDSHCPENEHLSLSGAACQRNCTNYKDWIVPCPLIWRPGCVCDSGYVRSSEGKCIPTVECESANQHSVAIDFKCPTPDGKFEYPGNDRKYIQCTNSISTVQKCRGYQLFDNIKKKCVYH